MVDNTVVVALFCFAYLISHVVANRDCLNTCTSYSAQSCCVDGELYGAVESEALNSVSAGNDVLWRIEEDLLRLSRTEAQQQQQLGYSFVMSAETVQVLAMRACHWLQQVKSKLARFSTHEIVGAAARRLYDTVRSQERLLMNLVFWLTDEIDGMHSPPPTVNGYGPCGGHWPCQQTVTCTRQSCLDGPRNPLSVPPGYVPYSSMAQPTSGDQSQYVLISIDPHFLTPSEENPFYFSSVPNIPVSISVKEKPDTRNKYKTSSGYRVLKQTHEHLPEQVKAQEKSFRIFSSINRYTEAADEHPGNVQVQPSSTPSPFEDYITPNNTTRPVLLDSTERYFIFGKSVGETPSKEKRSSQDEHVLSLGIPRAYKVRHENGASKVPSENAKMPQSHPHLPFIPYWSQ